MGLAVSILQVPLRLLSTCIGSCAAVGCVRLAGAGTVGNAWATSCVLVWLQLFSALLLVLTASVTRVDWIEQSCEQLSTLKFLHVTDSADLGICSCQESTASEDCWSEQLVYRAAAATCAVYMFLVLLALSGCAVGAARYYTAGKFLAVIVLWIASLLAPNGAFNTFGAVASFLSSLFGVVQCVLLLDFACTIHEIWFGAARRSRNRGSHEQSIIAASLALVITAWVSAVVLWWVFPQARGVIFATQAGSLLLLVVSITDWCEHGTLFTSAVMMLYSTWLLSEALQSQLQWPRLAMCAATVLLILQSFTSDTQTEGLSQGFLAGAGAGGDASVDVDASDPAAPMTKQELRSFILQSLMHAVVPLYCCSILAPHAAQTHGLAFTGNILVLFLSLLIYAWHLVAPKILTGRHF